MSMTNCNSGLFLLESFFHEWVIHPFMWFSDFVWVLSRGRYALRFVSHWHESSDERINRYLNGSRRASEQFNTLAIISNSCKLQDLADERDQIYEKIHHLDEGDPANEPLFDRLKIIEDTIALIPTANNPEDQEAMDFIRKAAQMIREKDQEERKKNG